jgi:hypothetical protein
MIGTKKSVWMGAVKRLLKILAYIAAALYLLVDAIFMTLAKPIADWIAEHVALRRLRDWIKSLPPYPSLALFSVPVIVLEPIKPIAAYLAATGRPIFERSCDFHYRRIAEARFGGEAIQPHARKVDAHSHLREAV